MMPVFHLLVEVHERERGGIGESEKTCVAVDGRPEGGIVVICARVDTPVFTVS